MPADSPVALFPLFCQILNMAAACCAGLSGYSSFIRATSLGGIFNSSASDSQSLSKRLAMSVKRMVARCIASGLPKNNIQLCFFVK